MNLKRHHVLYGLLALVLIFALVFFFYPHPSAVSFTQSSETVSTTTMTIGTSTTTASSIQPMRFEIVTTDAAQERGLGGRADIPQNYGMLFVFPVAKQYGFWMKDMLTSIDMIWLSDKGTILAIDASVSPATYPKGFYPPQPVRLVLETRAGEAARRGWSVGTTIQLPSSSLSSSPSKK
ncbi:MAG: hypothetical protein JWN90_326 [Parcubacteria group bacterium]|nr:hypothetical protein [Parcubacteria group bacterium]